MEVRLITFERHDCEQNLFNLGFLALPHNSQLSLVIDLKEQGNITNYVYNLLSIDLISSSDQPPSSKALRLLRSRDFVEEDR